MRIALAGDGSLPALVYDGLVDRGHAIVAGIYGTDGDFPDRCERDGVPYMPVDQLAIAHVAGPFLRQTGADLLVLANVTVLLPRAVFETPPLGTICFHPSLLPRHRGRHAVRDALAAGDRVTGVSVFAVDDGIDTGPLLDAAVCEVPPGISPGGLYYRHLVPIGADLLLRTIARLNVPMNV